MLVVGEGVLRSDRGSEADRRAARGAERLVVERYDLRLTIGPRTVRSRAGRQQRLPEIADRAIRSRTLSRRKSSICTPRATSSHVERRRHRRERLSAGPSRCSPACCPTGSGCSRRARARAVACPRWYSEVISAGFRDRQLHGQRLRERPHGFLHRPADDRHVDVQALRAARLDERLHLQLLERIADDQRGFAHLIERRARRPGSRSKCT